MNNFQRQTLTPQRFHIQRHKLANRAYKTNQTNAYFYQMTPRHAAFNPMNHTYTSDGISPYITPSQNLQTLNHDMYGQTICGNQTMITKVMPTPSSTNYYLEQKSSTTNHQYDYQQQAPMVPYCTDQQWDYGQNQQSTNQYDDQQQAYYYPQMQQTVINAAAHPTQIIQQQFNQTNVLVQQNVAPSEQYSTSMRCRWVEPRTLVQCQRVFSCPKLLEEHLDAEHISKEKPYICHWLSCDKQCEQRYKVVNHSRVHTGHKPFRCHFENCGKTFARSENLKIHQRVHTGEKPFKCKHCGRCFANSSDRKKHQHVHDTSGQQFICPRLECGKRYTHPSSLRKHVKKHEDFEREQMRKRQYDHHMEQQQQQMDAYFQPCDEKKLQRF
ncbi:hypothetical protein ACOME3_006039 [Neoechinorhynchus agilis]